MFLEIKFCVQNFSQILFPFSPITFMAIRAPLSLLLIPLYTFAQAYQVQQNTQLDLKCKLRCRKLTKLGHLAQWLSSQTQTGRTLVLSHKCALKVNQQLTKVKENFLWPESGTSTINPYFNHACKIQEARQKRRTNFMQIQFKYFYSQMTFFSAGKFVTTEKGSLQFLAQKIAF